MVSVQVGEDVRDPRPEDPHFVASYTPDRLPVFAEVRPGVIAVGAHSGHGNVLGSAAASAAMAIALGRSAPRLAQLLRPEHWA